MTSKSTITGLPLPKGSQTSLDGITLRRKTTHAANGERAVQHRTMFWFCKVLEIKTETGPSSDLV